MKFDFACGNPPFNDSKKRVIYDRFVFKSNEISDRSCWLVPARWTVSGRGTRRLRQAVLNGALPAKSVEFVSQEEAGFEKVDIRGGYAVLQLASGHDTQSLQVNGQRIHTRRLDVIPRNPQVLPVVREVLESADEFLNERYIAMDWSGIDTNLTFIGAQHTEPVCFNNPESIESPVKIFASQRQGFEKWVEAHNTNHAGGDFHKVATPRGAGNGYDGFGNLFVIGPGETFTNTYVAFRCESGQEARHLVSFLESDFADFFLRLRKVSQQVSRHALKWIPIPDLSRDWNDAALKCENPFDLSQSALDVIYERK